MSPHRQARIGQMRGACGRLEVVLQMSPVGVQKIRSALSALHRERTPTYGMCNPKERFAAYGSGGQILRLEKLDLTPAHAQGDILTDVVGSLAGLVCFINHQDMLPNLYRIPDQMPQKLTVFDLAVHNW